jgi:hypothetical protein
MSRFIVMLTVINLNAILLSDIMQKVVLPNVLAPK